MTNTKEREGLILIPDLSGFTTFVFATNTHVGTYIIKQLLLTLIEANKKYFYVSEIEGDAILCYKYSKKPSFERVAHVIESMQKAFSFKVAEIERDLDTKIEMTLKFIVHYGTFSRYTIKDFNKLYGKPIVEAHKLLKNEYAIYPSYILYTNSFWMLQK